MNKGDATRIAQPLKVASTQLGDIASVEDKVGQPQWSTTSDAIVRISDSDSIIRHGRELRETMNWGSAYVPPPPSEQHRLEFRRIVDDLFGEAQSLKQGLSCGKEMEELAGVIAEIEDGLNRLYRCKWGEDESLKSVVVAIQLQVLNVEWSVPIAAFLLDATHMLRARYRIDASTIEQINDIIDEHELDTFRGVFTEPVVQTRYRLERVDGDRDEHHN